MPADNADERIEPHLTFRMLLEDTMQEMATHEDVLPPLPDASDILRDEAVAELRASESSPVPRPFHHAYLTPISTAVLMPRPARFDLRY